METPTENSLRYKWLPSDQQGLPATMASAAMAGLLSRAVMHPIDTAKAVIQVQTKAQNIPKTLFGRSRTLQTLSSIWKVDGVRGFYRGFAAYELLKSRLLTFSQGYKDQKKPAADMSFGAALLLDSVCGFSAEAISCVLYLPMDVCKERLQVYSAMQAEGFQGKKPTLREVVRVDGLRGLYRGYGATLLSFGPFSALFFTLNHQYSGIVQRLLGPKLDTSAPQARPECRPVLDAIVAGAAAGSASIVTAPLDKVKLRLQVQSEAAGGRPAPFYYRHFFHDELSQNVDTLA